MGLACLITGHDFEVSERTKTENNVTLVCVQCQSCGKEDWIEEGIVCDNFECQAYVVGMNYLEQSTPHRQYSQRCYRCPRCGDCWHDEDKDMLEGKWYAVDGKAIHSTEMG